MTTERRRHDVRLVPMTREERDWLADLWIEYLGNPNPCPLVAAWDAAPADATEAVTRALVECQHRSPGMGQGAESIDDLYTPEGAAAIRMGAVLRALGVPDASPTETEPHEH